MFFFSGQLKKVAQSYTPGPAALVKTSRTHLGSEYSMGRYHFPTIALLPPFPMAGKMRLF
jgi:hypothetical protein